MFIYPDIIEKIRSSCRDHINDRCSADAVQAMIHIAEFSIVAIEEKDIRNFFTNCEGRLELIKFTVNEDQQNIETKALANEMLAWLAARETRSGSSI